MKLIFSPIFKKQLEVIAKIANKGNSDYVALYNQIGIAIKVIKQIKSLKECPLKLRIHNGNVDNPGYLTGRLSPCMAIDLDKTNRFVLFQPSEDGITLTALGHYEISIGGSKGQEKWLFGKDLEEQFEQICQLNSTKLQRLKSDSFVLEKELLEALGIDNCNITNSIIHKFNKLAEGDLCPIDIESAKKKLHSESDISSLIDVDQYGHIKLTPEYESLIKRATANARYLSNIGVEAISDGDLLKAAQLNVAMNKKMFKDFANMIHYINTHVKYPKEKKILFDSMNDTFLSSYISCQEQVQSGIGSLRQFESILANAVVNDLSRKNTDNETNKEAVVNLTKHQYLMKFRKLNEEQHYTHIFKNVAKEISERESKIESKRADEIKSPKKGFHL